MQCPQCHYENLSDAAFCQECGAKLQNVCSQCRTNNLPTARFCRACGTPLTAQLSPSQTPNPELRTVDARPQALDSRPTVGERRQLTVMFCDLVGSTALSEQLDPEELHAVLQNYQVACARAINRYEGHIAQYLGDGLLVYFGYPTAHEDDAQRAVRAGLGILTELEQLNATAQSAVGTTGRSPLQVRIGIHTGPVMVGEIGHEGKREQLALGETPNIAARLQALAEPDTVVISAATYELVQGLFECRNRGPQKLKGLSTSLSVYQVLGEGEAHSRFEVAIKTGLTPLIGREQEVNLLCERWERAKAGEGQVVLLSGEAGIGKSRLTQVLKERSAGEPHTRIECRCSPFYQNSALYPVIDHLQRLLQFREHELPQDRLHKLEEALARYGFPLQEAVPLFAVLLSVPLSEHYPPLNLTPQKQKQKILETLVAWLLKEAERQPVRFDMEDLHWADPSTLEFLTLLIDQVPTTPLLILLTFRPEFRPPWGMRSHLAQISLNRLARKQIGEMVEKVAGGKALPPEVVQQVIAKTDGVPLFVEELTKMVIESIESIGSVESHNRPSLQAIAIPATLHDSLMARLDRLGSAKEVAQLGATLGREFSYELLHAVSPLNEEILQQGLRQLVEAELFYQRGLPPQATYIFKHALIQDAAYQSLLKSRRQQLHQRIARVLEEQFVETRETQPELLAHHYTEAGLVTQAVPCWQQAGEKAVQRSANTEAISHLTKGLELLETLPDTAERAQQELTLQITLGGPFIATKGYTAPEVERVYARARELCQQVGETSQLFQVLLGLFAFHIVRSEYKTARELGEQCLTLAQSAQDPAFLLEAHGALGQCLYLLGEFVLAREHLEQGIVLYGPQPHYSYALHWRDPGVVCRSWIAFALWILGYPDQALKRTHEALALARELSHTYDMAVALGRAAMLYRLRQERQAMQARAEETISLATEHGFPFFAAQGAILQGWTLAEQGQTEVGIAQINQGLAAFRIMGIGSTRPYNLALLAEACEKAGQVEEGLTTLDEALAMVDKNGERFYEAELYRLKGELTLQKFQVSGSKFQVADPRPLTSDPQAEAEECFLKAIDIARRQQAKSLELRAVMSLARLWQQQRKREEARLMLAEIYDWFTEGFDTADLQEAKALLEALS